MSEIATPWQGRRSAPDHRLQEEDESLSLIYSQKPRINQYSTIPKAKLPLLARTGDQVPHINIVILKPIQLVEVGR